MSTISCLARPDINIVTGFICLSILVRYFVKDPYYFNSLLFYCMVISIVFDIIWIILILPCWNTNYALPNNKIINTTELSFIRSLVSLLSFLEILVKVVFMYINIKGFDNTGHKIPKFMFKATLKN